MTDYYLQDASRLRGQPKKTIGDYVESKGILVPRRFNSFVEAKNSGLPVIARSEHIQEYDGASGLFASPVFYDAGWKDITYEEELLQKSLYERFKGFTELYTIYLNLDVLQFKKEISFSYWEKLGGRNHMVIADSAIPERYHITSHSYFKEENKRFNRADNRYYIIEKGKIILESISHQVARDSCKDIEELVLIYEKIRNLENFDAQHCPLMEFQTENGLHYFLQYHRTRDFDPSSFVLERRAEEGEIEALLVRGKTPPGGIMVKTIVAYADSALSKPYHQWRIPQQEEAFFGISCNYLVDEIMSRRRKVWFDENYLQSALFNIATKHGSRSYMFKPELSLIVKEERLRAKDELSVWTDTARKTGEDQAIYVHVISDGRKAYIKRV